MNRFRLAITLSLLLFFVGCTPSPKLPQFTRGQYFYSNLEVPGFPYSFVYLEFGRNFADGTADGDITLYRNDARVNEGGNFISRQVRGQFELSFFVSPSFDLDNPLASPEVEAKLLLGVRPEALNGTLLVPEMSINREVRLTGPVSESKLSSILDTFE